MAKPPLLFTFYIAAPIDKVWNGFVSKEANQTIFMCADFEADSNTIELGNTEVDQRCLFPG